MNNEKRNGRLSFIMAALLLCWLVFMVYLYVSNPFGGCDDLPCYEEREGE